MRPQHASPHRIDATKATASRDSMLRDSPRASTNYRSALDTLDANRGSRGSYKETHRSHHRGIGRLHSPPTALISLAHHQILASYHALVERADLLLGSLAFSPSLIGGWDVPWQGLDTTQHERRRRSARLLTGQTDPLKKQQRSVEEGDLRGGELVGLGTQISQQEDPTATQRPALEPR